MCATKIHYSAFIKSFSEESYPEKSIMERFAYCKTLEIRQIDGWERLLITFLKKGVWKCGEKWNILYFYSCNVVWCIFMMQFLGNIEAKADAKGRIFVPAVFRKRLQNEGEEYLVLRKDIFQDCLVLYPGTVWESEIEKLRLRLNRWNKEQQLIFRQFVLDAERLEMDANGRILIPKRYLQMANIEVDVRFLGVDETIEIWAKEKLEQPLISPDEFSDKIQQLME